jgi:hypothetical protein
VYTDYGRPNPVEALSRYSTNLGINLGEAERPLCPHRLTCSFCRILGSQGHQIAFLPVYFSYYHTTLPPPPTVHAEPSLATMDFRCGRSHSRCTECTRGISPLVNITSRKSWEKTAIWSPQTEPQITRILLLSQVLKLQSHQYGTHRVVTNLRCHHHLRLDHTEKYAIPVTCPILPCQHSSPMALTHTEAVSHQQYEVSRRGICSSLEPSCQGMPRPLRLAIASMHA